MPGPCFVGTPLAPSVGVAPSYGAVQSSAASGAPACSIAASVPSRRAPVSTALFRDASTAVPRRTFAISSGCSWRAGAPLRLAAPPRLYARQPRPVVRAQAEEAAEPSSAGGKWLSVASAVAVVAVGAWLVATHGTKLTEEFIRSLSSQLLDVAKKLGIALVGVAAVRVARRLVRKLLRASTKTPFATEHSGFTRLLPMIESMADIGLICVGTLCVLGTLGIDVSAIVAGLGLSGFALGFALKDMISNFLAGILVIIFQPFKNGDLVSVQSFKGRVVNVDLRYTTLQCSAEGGSTETILIPNQIILSNTVTVIS